MALGQSVFWSVWQGVMQLGQSLGFASFFEQIIEDLYKSVYLALGGSLEDQSYDWAQRGLVFVSTAIKILILLLIIGFVYWLLVYVVKHSQRFFRTTDKQIKVMRSFLRYLWFVMGTIAVLSQVGVAGTTVKAFAKASAWAGFFYLLWSMSGYMAAQLMRHYDLNESIGQLFRNLMLVLILFLASGLILAQFGFDIVSLVAGLGIVGFAVGFAAQSTLASVIAGITILIEQSFQVGDWIRVGTQEGRVVRITLRTTHILDRNNIVVIFPNATVASSDVVNLTSKSFIRFDVPVRVALDADIDKARTVIMRTLKQNDAVLPHPLSTATVERIGEYDIYFIVRFWISPASVARLPIIKERIIETIKNALDAEGMTTPYPHMQLVNSDVPAIAQQLMRGANQNIHRTQAVNTQISPHKQNTERTKPTAHAKNRTDIVDDDSQGYTQLDI